MIIRFVRHGLSIANEEHLVTGTQSDSLSEEGTRQVSRLSDWLGERISIDDIFYCSPWMRAQETARLLAQHVEWRLDDRLGETHAGTVADWMLDEFRQRYPNFYDSPKNNYPEGESHIDLNNRVISWLEEIITSDHANKDTGKENTYIVVTHSGPIACILQSVLGIQMDQFPALLVGNATVTSLLFSNNVIECGRLLCLSSGPDSEICMRTR